MKGICKICDEMVQCCELRLSKESGIKGDQSSEKPFYLCVEHPPKEGCKVGEVVSTEDGAFIRNFCGGSISPPRSLVQVH